MFTGLRQGWGLGPGAPLMGPGTFAPARPLLPPSAHGAGTAWGRAIRAPCRSLGQLSLFTGALFIVVSKSCCCRGQVGLHGHQPGVTLCQKTAGAGGQQRAGDVGDAAGLAVMLEKQKPGSPCSCAVPAGGVGAGAVGQEQWGKLWEGVKRGSSGKVPAPGPLARTFRAKILVQSHVFVSILC